MSMPSRRVSVRPSHLSSRCLEYVEPSFFHVKRTEEGESKLEVSSGVGPPGPTT